MKKSTWFLTGMAALLLSFGLILTGCDNPDDPDDDTTKNKVVSALTLGSLVTVPVWDAQPVTTAINETRYSGSIAWQKADGSSFTGAFAASTVYQAVLTLTTKLGFTFTGLGANSGTVTITFPAIGSTDPDDNDGGDKMSKLLGTWIQSGGGSNMLVIADKGGNNVTLQLWADEQSMIRDWQ